jgi:hypothetical protein
MQHYHKNSNEKARKETQMKFNNVMAVTTLLCGSEVWITNQNQQN